MYRVVPKHKTLRHIHARASAVWFGCELYCIETQELSIATLCHKRFTRQITIRDIHRIMTSPQTSYPGPQIAALYRIIPIGENRCQQHTLWEARAPAGRLFAIACSISRIIIEGTVW